MANHTYLQLLKCRFNKFTWRLHWSSGTSAGVGGLERGSLVRAFGSLSWGHLRFVTCLVSIGIPQSQVSGSCSWHHCGATFSERKWTTAELSSLFPGGCDVDVCRPQLLLQLPNTLPLGCCWQSSSHGGFVRIWHGWGLCRHRGKWWRQPENHG